MKSMIHDGSGDDVASVYVRALLVTTWPIGTEAAQSPVVGVASIIDGDTLEIRGQHVRLHGIDAPESGQFCEKDSSRYRCSQQAALGLCQSKIAGREIGPVKDAQAINSRPSARAAARFCL